MSWFINGKKMPKVLWFWCEMFPLGSCVWMLDLQCVVLFWGVVELLGRWGLPGWSGFWGEILEICSHSQVFVSAFWSFRIVCNSSSMVLLPQSPLIPCLPHCDQLCSFKSWAKINIFFPMLLHTDCQLDGILNYLRQISMHVCEFLVHIVDLGRHSLNVDKK